LESPNENRQKKSHFQVSGNDIRPIKGRFRCFGVAATTATAGSHASASPREKQLEDHFGQDDEGICSSVTVVTNGDTEAGMAEGRRGETAPGKRTAAATGYPCDRFAEE
jgi:hypothetical protein